MKYATIFPLSLLIMMSTVTADTYVDAYTRADGTYVKGHYRSDQNDTATDNWSYSGNVNPYTGKVGTSEHLQYDETDNDYDADYQKYLDELYAPESLEEAQADYDADKRPACEKNVDNNPYAAHVDKILGKCKQNPLNLTETL